MTEVFKTGVVGAGHVGLVTGACLAHLGHRVVCVDKDEERISELKAGQMPVYEPGLEELVFRGVRGERLSFTGSDGLTGLVREADAVFIAVDSPRGKTALRTSETWRPWPEGSGGRSPGRDENSR